jgi:hypothetical protein
MTAAPRAAMPSRLVAAACAAPAGLALAAAGFGWSPLAVAGATAVAAATVAAGRRYVRKHGVHAAWLAAVALSLLAGPLSSLSFGGQNGRLLWADLVVALGVAVALARGRAGVGLPRAGFLHATAAFCAFGAISVVWARDPLTAIAELKEWLVAIVVLAAALSFAADRRRSSWLLVVVALTGALVAGLMAVAAARSPFGPVLAVLLKKVDLPFGRSNYLAGILILALPIALGGFGASASLRARLGWLALALANAAGLALSASKGAILALVAAVLVAYVPAGRAARAGLAIMAALLAAGVAAFVYGPLNQVLAYRMQRSALAYSTGERWDLYVLAWESFLRRPLVGVGLNNFSVVANRLTGVDTVPHNFQLGFLAELGVAGAALACAWLAALLLLGHRAVTAAGSHRGRALALGVWCALVAFALHNQFESTLYGQQVKILVALTAAAAWGLRAGSVATGSAATR